MRAGWRRIRDHLSTVTNDSIARVSRQTAGSNQNWNLYVQPSGSDHVTLVVKATTSCSNAHAICTANNQQKLGNARP